MFEGHSHYVMQVALNPKDTNTFASASLDRTVKVRLEGLHAAMPATIQKQLSQSLQNMLAAETSSCAQ